MIASDQNKALIIVGNAASENPLWLDFADYCYKREEGLRKAAFIHLEKFISSALLWSEIEKIDFLKFLFPYFENLEDANYVAFPHPIKEQLLRPVLLAWCEKEQMDSTPFRWYGRYFANEDYLLKALNINPEDHQARETLINRQSYQIYYSIHHLPDYYLGDVDFDKALMDKLREDIQLLPDDRKVHWIEYLAEDFEILENYLEWRHSGNPTFEEWGMQNNKKVGYR